MSNGVFIYPTGFKGTTPVNINGSVAIPLGGLDVNPLKINGSYLQNNITHNLTSCTYPIYLLVQFTSSGNISTNETASAGFTYGGTSCTLGSKGTNQSSGQLYPFPNFFLPLTSQSNFILNVSRYAKDGPTYFTSKINGIYKKASDILDKTNTNTTIRFKTETENGGLNPQYVPPTYANFSSWGTEYNSTQYTYVSGIDDTYNVHTSSSGSSSYSANVGRTDIVVKMTINSEDEGYTYIMPLICESYSANRFGGNSLQIWNFNTSSWDSLGSLNPAQLNLSIGDHKGFPFGYPALKTNYVSNGEIMIRYEWTVGSGGYVQTTNVGYLGVVFLNKYGENVHI